ncbi:hypothetical protein [Streptomyces antimicrobicus]|uniref:Lipoprotein n=1 Tax=Streptomyces antimicrobicus TaxID=2883108 RepID=A0ABS8BBK8_9ACTN|nr:hypothetical protein [Streptomyces antimicrobicus]MCB5182031.1 hypothetical protein [Streptomyces antimicrobicus]
MPWTTPSRRSLLATAAGAALLTGCSGGGRSASGSDAPLERRVREAAVRDSEALLERYDATVRAHPALGPRLAPLRAAVAEHVGALRPDGARPTPSPGGSRAAAGAPQGARGAKGAPAIVAVTVPDQPAEAVAELADAERGLAEARVQVLADAPGELARLLASVAACGIVHHHLLTSNPGGQE